MSQPALIAFVIHKHPAGAALVLVRCGQDGNALIGRFGPARLDRDNDGFALPAGLVGKFSAFVCANGGAVIEAGEVEPEASGPIPYDPLPCCGWCGYGPIRRHVAGCRVKACPVPEHVLYGPGKGCPHCGAEYGTERPPATAEQLEKRKKREDEFLAEVAARRVALHESLGLPPMDPDLATARGVVCPWCQARPGIACTVPGTDRPLTVTAAHPARFAAAGLTTSPRVDPELLKARKSPPDVLAGLVRPTEPEESDDAAE